MLNTLIALLTTLLTLVGAVLAFRAARTARTPQGALGWAIFLVAAPWLAIPAYLFLGQARYPGYVSARRASVAVVRALDLLRHLHRARLADAPGGPLARIVAFEELARLPLVSGNAAELLIDGERAFESMFEAIEQARSYVLVAFYILRDDAVGQDLKRRLIAKAEAGIDVHVLYDALGSWGLPDRYLEELREAGVEIENFHARRRPRSRFQRNFRNHRKIVVADGHVAFVGGLNVGDEYLGRSARFGHWRDTHLRLEGPVVAQVQLVFAEDWHWATGEHPALHWKPRAPEAELDAMILAPGPADVMETGSLFFCNAIGAARRRLWIASPYFVPDVDLLSALKLAALRGVDVRILVADRRDHLVVWLAAFAFFDEVREAGVKIHRYTDGFLHQKVLLVDDELASVGSVNLDNRSCRLNFEITALVFDRGFAAQVEAMLEADFERSFLFETGLDEGPLWRRYGAPMARLFAPVL
ncbi:MAG: cardiolipin synthase [Tistlia sp.]|uniref:cardiolipin synthase n=1 Tax=Tistlia sp. TaxID=3057121 RepID=UPI0034A599CA